MDKQAKRRQQSLFQKGDMVRVRKGIQDPDFPDIPMSGWVGMVKEVLVESHEITYQIQWNRETLAQIHPVYHSRCERDGLDYELTYLGEADLEPWGGDAISVEQPTKIRTPELSSANQDDRVRTILKATGNDPVPSVEDETLFTYWQYLQEHLTLPFKANYCPEDKPDREVTVTGLPDPREYECDEFYGLFCKARWRMRHIVVALSEIEVKKGNPNHQLIDDYTYWFWNWR